MTSTPAGPAGRRDMARLPTMEWEGDHGVVGDEAEANRLFNRHGVGTPLRGNGLRLAPVEAAWLLATGRIDCPDIDLAGVLQGHDEAEYLCYRDLRERGLRIKAVDSRRLEVEGRSGDDAFTVHVVSDRDAASVEAIAAAAGGVLGAIDEDGAPTYYSVGQIAPAGSITLSSLPAATGRLLGDRVLVTAEPSDARGAGEVGEAGDRAAAYRREAIGMAHEEGVLLSLMEAAWLVRRGVLHLDGDAEAEGAARQHHFRRTFPAYLALRSAGVAPRSGFRFGTHLRAYDAHPDDSHARWLIHCIASDDRPHWSEVSRGVRLAHGVRKEFLVATPDAEGVRFWALAWYRP